MDIAKQIGMEHGDVRWESIDFRHLGAFQRVFQEKNYAIAGQQMFSNRKSIVRMMQNLERSFGCSLFTEGPRGELVASGFAERLYNDLRLLNSARNRMKDHISAIHEQGRILHVGSSAAVFRTREFRDLFRELQSMDGIRICYSPIDSADAGKALVSGSCDLYIGCWKGTANRFTTSLAGRVPFRVYRRSQGDPAGKQSTASYQVSLDGLEPGSTRFNGNRGKFRPLDASWWLYWLDHPDDCPDGTVIFGPDVEVDPKHWEVMDDPADGQTGQTLHASFLRQHPYEFLPGLAHRLQNRPLP